jgi:hypothetical protein
LGGCVPPHSARFKGCNVVLEMLAKFAKDFFFPASFKPQLAQALSDQS